MQNPRNREINDVKDHAVWADQMIHFYLSADSYSLKF